jgi:hypothetical protein
VVERQPSQQALEGDLLLEALGRQAGAQRLVAQPLEQLRSEAGWRPTALPWWHGTMPPRRVV